MIDGRVFLALPLKFQQICTIYPPTVQQVLEDDQYLTGYRLLTYTKDDIEDLLKGKDKKKVIENVPTPLEFILGNIQRRSDFKDLVIAAFQNMTHEKVTFLFEEKAIVLGSLKDLANIKSINELRILDKDNFFDFQNMLRLAMGDEQLEKIKEDENPVVARVKAKARKRQKVAKKTASKKGGISLGTSLCAICCMGIGITPLNIGEISYASVKMLMDMYQTKEKYDVDVRSIIAGADPKKVKTTYWIGEKSDVVEVEI